MTDEVDLDDAIQDDVDADGPVIRQWLPTVEAAATIELMTDDEDLEPYLDHGTIDNDAALDVIADYVLNPDLDRKDVENLPASDTAAIFDAVTQDATNQAAVRPEHFDDGDQDGGDDDV